MKKTCSIKTDKFVIEIKTNENFDKFLKYYKHIENSRSTNQIIDLTQLKQVKINTPKRRHIYESY